MRLASSTRVTACRASSTSSTSDAPVDAAIVAYPHGAAAPAVAALRERGVRVVDLRADFRLLDRGVYERLVRPHGAPELIGGARLRADELQPRASPGAAPSPAGLLPDRGAARARAARARRADRRRVIDAKTGVCGAGRARHGHHALRVGRRGPKPYKVGGHRHRPEIEQELAAGGRRQRRLRPRTWPRWSNGELDSCYVQAARPSLRRRSSTTCSRRRYADEPFVTVLDRPAGRAQGA